MKNKKIIKIRNAQALVRNFAKRNKWSDLPNIDKIDHLHEELSEISQHIRYKSKSERIKFVKANKEIFEEEIGDLFFGTCRLANQFGVDLEKCFDKSQKKILVKYNCRNKEKNIINKRK